MDAPKCGTPLGAHVTETIPANIVIIRHGIDPGIFAPVPDVMLPRQMMPYHVCF